MGKQRTTSGNLSSFIACSIANIVAVEMDDAVDPVSVSIISYRYFLSEVRTILKDVLGLDVKNKDDGKDDIILGTHLMRKTAYIFSLFGMLNMFH